MNISQETIDFLVENHIQNSREWYKENRHKYKELVEKPLLDLTEKIMPAILKIDPSITSNPKLCLSRLWLDMRLNRSGLYFRDHMWLKFRREKGMVYPSFFFEFGPDGYRYGVGYYSAASNVMTTMRKWILHDDERYLKAQKAMDELPDFTVQGDLYKRNKFPDASPKKQNWLNRKSIFIAKDSTNPKLLFSENLGKTLSKDFTKLAPVYLMFLSSHLENLV